MYQLLSNDDRLAVLFLDCTRGPFFFVLLIYNALQIWIRRQFHRVDQKQPKSFIQSNGGRSGTCDLQRSIRQMNPLSPTVRYCVQAPGIRARLLH